MAHQLKSLRERVDDIAKLKSDYSLADVINNRQVIIQSDRRLTHSFVDASTVLGRDKDKEIILEYLLNVGGGETVSILPIVGIGGLGKTTLAKFVYNDERVGSHFEKKVWVCVSDDFELKTVLIKIITSAKMKESSERCENWDIDQLQTVLRDTFNNKRYLLVLDDVWNEDRGKWEELRAMLMGGASGSRILVTTRSHQIASMMCSVSLSPHELHGLCHEDCVSLFYKCAFKDVHEVERYSRLKQIGEQIVRKCKEVPLAVVTLGNSLFGKTDENDWKRIRDSEIWRIEQKENDILPALRISYEQLPSYLKRCFAHCSFFPKDFQYSEFSVVPLWMAHGLLQSKNDNEELEEIGSRYFKELISRSFFQDIYEKYGFLRCKMHDLIHDLAVSLMQKECFIITSASHEQLVSNNNIPRHLRFTDPTSLPNNLPFILKNLDGIRSLTSLTDSVSESPFSHHSILQLCLSKFQYLRLLDLRYLKVEMLPKEIGRLKHLRFLNLGCSRIKRLPISLFKLQNLQTLWLVGCVDFEELPSDIRYLINLRSLAITTQQKILPNNGIGCLKSLRFLFIEACENLEFLFEDMQGLSNLRTLVIENCYNLIRLPRSMTCLTALERLIIVSCNRLDLKMEEEGKNNQQVLPQFHLKILMLYDFSHLEEFPEWLLRGSTDSLQRLRLLKCPNLKEFPEILKDITSLQTLGIEDCDRLEERCTPETGEDWFKIAHIPNIILNNEDIRSESTNEMSDDN